MWSSRRSRPDWDAGHDNTAEGRPGATNVLFLHRGGDQIRGSEQALLRLFPHLDRSRFVPIVLCSDQVMADAAAAAGVEAHLLDFPELMLEGRSVRAPLGRYLSALGALHRFCRWRGVGLILCNGGGPCQLGVPIAAWRRIPLLCFFHHPAPRLYQNLWLMPRVRHFVFPSRFTAAQVAHRASGIARVVPLAVDCENRFVPAPSIDPSVRQKLGLPAGAVVFAQIGALTPHKGHGLLLEAFARVVDQYPGAHLLIIGDGAEAERLRRRIEQPDLSGKVTLTGRVPDVLPYLQHAIDVHVLASREEGLGLVNLEASACGIPVIGSDTGGIRESIVGESTGILFRAEDAEDLSRAMLRLGRDGELRRAMGREGRRWVARRFSSAEYAREMQEAMQETLTSAADMRGGAR